MTETSHDTLPDDAEIFAAIVHEQTKRNRQIMDYIHLSPRINGVKYGKTTYSTPSPEDNRKREELVASWQETGQDYCARLARFGFILPAADPYSPHPSAPVAIHALRSNDPAIFENDPQSLLIAEAMLLRIVRERLAGSPPAPQG